MDLSKYDYLLKDKGKDTPPGIYNVLVDKIKIDVSTKGNHIIKTVFKDYPYCGNTFNYVRVIPEDGNQYKIRLLKDFIQGLGIQSLTQLETVKGKKYNINLTYKGTFANITFN